MYVTEIEGRLYLHYFIRQGERLRCPITKEQHKQLKKKKLTIRGALLENVQDTMYIIHQHQSTYITMADEYMFPDNSIYYREEA